MRYKPRSGGFEGNTPLVNRTLDPTHTVGPTLYRSRILHGSDARIFRLALSDGTPFQLIGNDGGSLPVPVSSLPEIGFLSPAERLDVLVDLSLADGEAVMLRDLNTGWDLLELVANASIGASGAAAPASPPAIIDLSQTQIAGVRGCHFGGMSMINGRLYDMERIDFEVPWGQFELWRFTTNGNAPHPVHVHRTYYQVQSRTGGRSTLYSWEHGGNDTVLVEDDETVEVLIRFDRDCSLNGTHLMHFHKLEHEAMGMMSNFRVVANS